MDRPNLPPNLNPAERFALVMRGLLAVSKDELNEQIANHPLPPQKRGPKAKKAEKPTR